MNAKLMAQTLRDRADKIQNREQRLETDLDDAELMRVLARVVEGKDLYRAFGAPGDWGYTNEIGKALAAREDQAGK